MVQRLRPRSGSNTVRCATRHVRIAVRSAYPEAALELLEGRRLLSVAPVAVDDGYDLGPDGRLSVDVTQPSPIPENPLPPPPAFDESQFVQPTGPWTTPDFVKTIEGGQT